MEDSSPSPHETMSPLTGMDGDRRSTTLVATGVDGDRISARGEDGDGSGDEQGRGWEREWR